MKRLWTVIPPCYSDIHGFQAVVNATDGLGLVDDPSRYPLLSIDGEGHRERHGGHGEGGPGGPPDREKTGQRPHGGRACRHPAEAAEPESARSGAAPGQEAPRSCEPGRHPPEGQRVTHTGIRESDIIRGTEQKVRAAFAEDTAWFHPTFVLMTTAPSASMIGSDLGNIAADLAQTGSIPVGVVDLCGDRDYLYGVSMTLEALGKLLLAPAQTIPNTVNLLGCNTIDWTQDMLDNTRALLQTAGFQVHTVWGMQETAARLKSGAAAAVNLVVNIAGLRLARYMHEAYGVPYVVGAPFGAAQTRRILAALRDPSREVPISAGAETEAEVLILAEQLTANALRQVLEDQGFRAIRVLSFLDMDRELRRPGDGKLTGEDQLAEQLAAPSVKLVIGDPDYKPLTDRALPWIDLPDPGSMFPASPVPRTDLTGTRAEAWLAAGLTQAPGGADPAG